MLSWAYACFYKFWSLSLEQILFQDHLQIKIRKVSLVRCSSPASSPSLLPEWSVYLQGGRVSASINPHPHALPLYSTAALSVLVSDLLASFPMFRLVPTLYTWLSHSNLEFVAVSAQKLVPALKICLIFNESTQSSSGPLILNYMALPELLGGKMWQIICMGLQHPYSAISECGHRALHFLSSLSKKTQESKSQKSCKRRLIFPGQGKSNRYGTPRFFQMFFLLNYSICIEEFKITHVQVDGSSQKNTPIYQPPRFRNTTLPAFQKSPSSARN